MKKKRIAANLLERNEIDNEFQNEMDRLSPEKMISQTIMKMWE